MSTQATSSTPRGHDVRVRRLEEDDLSAADRIMRTAFSTFLGLPDPADFMGDAEYVRARWHADPEAAFGAVVDTELVGSNFATHWGSVGFFGPLSIRPDQWDRGVGKRLMEPVMECFERWGTAHAGLFTFAQSPKHVGLYQSFGFWPRYLTAISARTVGRPAPTSGWSRWSDHAPEQRPALLDACRELTDQVHAGLDVSREITAVDTQSLGEVLLLEGDRGLEGVAVCHAGPATEAGSGTCYVKFAAIRPGPQAARHFVRLLDACEEMAAQDGLARLVAGVSTARVEAYRSMLAHGFRVEFQGVSMHRPDDAGYSRPGVYVLDDWR